MDRWQHVYFDDKDYLEFDRIFYSKRIVNDANSDGIVNIRISDTNGTVIINDPPLEPGKATNLEQLERHTPYIVEIKTADGFLFWESFFCCF